MGIPTDARRNFVPVHDQLVRSFEQSLALIEGAPLQLVQGIVLAIEEISAGNLDDAAELLERALSELAGLQS